MLTVIFDPSRTSGGAEPSALQAEVAALRSFVKESPPPPTEQGLANGESAAATPLIIPGERAAANYRHREKVLSLELGTWKTLQEAGALVGVEEAVFEEACQP